MLNEALKANDKTLLSFVYDSLSATEVIHVAMSVKERANFPFLLKTGTMILLVKFNTFASSSNRGKTVYSDDWNL